MIRAALIALSLTLTACVTPGFAGDGHADAHNEPRPFDADRDANADVDAALAQAKERGTKALIVMGGNWCHDSRAFAAVMAQPDTAALIAKDYELVWVNVGMKVLNQDIAQRFGLDGTPGTPTVIVTDSHGVIMNAEDAPTWRNAASRDTDDIHQYFVDMAAQE